MVNGVLCWVADKTGKVHSGEGEVGLRARFRCCRRTVSRKPPPAPGVPLSRHRALHVSFPPGQPPLAAASGFGVQGVGMLLPR